MNKLYVFVRNDLPSLNTGKAMAQVAHCVSQFMDFDLEGSEEWCKEAEGFGTTIVMEGSKRDIDRLMENVEYCGCYNSLGKIVDPTYPFKLQKEIIPYLKEDANIVYNKETMDKYGMVDATRKAHTASWVFVNNEKDLEWLREEINENNIRLFH